MNNTPPEKPETLTVDNPESEKPKLKQKLVIAVISALLLPLALSTTYFAINSQIETSNPKPEPTPDISVDPSLNPLWTELLTLRENPALKEAPLFSCYKDGTVTFTNKQPSNSQLFSPMTSSTELTTGGVTVDFGEPECLTPTVIKGELSDKKFTEMLTFAAELSEQYELPQPEHFTDGRYLIQHQLLQTPTNQTITYIGVASIGEYLRAEETTEEVGNILFLLSYADEETLRAIAVSDSDLSLAVEALTTTLSGK